MNRQKALKAAQKALPGWTAAQNEEAAEDAAGAPPEKAAPALVKVMRKFSRGTREPAADAAVADPQSNGVAIVRMKPRHAAQDAPELTKAAVVDESGEMIGMEG